MSSDLKNPLNMRPDPFDGNAFIFPETKCTDERRTFINRYNEITAFLYTSHDALNKYLKDFESNIIPKLNMKENTPLRFTLSSGECIIANAKKITTAASEGVNIQTRQVFVMFYGSFETYLFQLLERSFPIIGIAEDILNKCREILMLKKWDGKFCKMNEVFDIGYKAKDLINHFKGFSLDFEGVKYKNPLSFFDEIANVRHRIVHASSFLENNKMISISMNTFHGLFGFFFLLTDYIDNLFAKKFGFDRKTINPEKA